mmetsp:Transcript_16166/g.36974  ORF Transcript_16166/g.36974 Transcript_16166/m.36974 type:complete len:674 (-) Transcript_16166:114-2135(-)
MLDAALDAANVAHALKGHDAEADARVWYAWAYFLCTHCPWFLIICFLVGGFVERLGVILLCSKARQARSAGVLPAVRPKVCVQLPMYNETAVAQRAVAMAAALAWPTDALEIQVLDDSTDLEAIAVTDEAVTKALADRPGLQCEVIRRSHRWGYKAGALEYARKLTDAQFIAIVDADFTPVADFLERAVAHFYDANGEPQEDLAMLQTQWGHVNHLESLLTRMQSLWIDDHHTMQMPYRSHVWGFVNFTGTAGVWRATAIEKAGGWKAHSLVEDCELSFRVLFAGMRTKFDATIVQPSELPNTYAAYKAQQRRWTKGWAQLARMHLLHLLYGYKCSPLKRIHLLYHMLISLQWPIWALWVLISPLLIAFGGLASLPDRLALETTFRAKAQAALPTATAASLDLWAKQRADEEQARLAEVPDLYNQPLFYLLPIFLFQLLMTVGATVYTRHTYGPTPGLPERFSLCSLCSRLRRVFPYVIISTGMLPHQMCSYFGGLYELGGEFERTPKTGESPDATYLDNLDKLGKSPTGSASSKSPKSPKSPATPLASVGKGGYGFLSPRGSTLGKALVPKEKPKVHGYQYVELAFVLYQLLWAIYFVLRSPLRVGPCSGVNPPAVCPTPLFAALPAVFSAYVGLCVALVALPSFAVFLPSKPEDERPLLFSDGASMVSSAA